jgi:hypothetical protein
MNNALLMCGFQCIANARRNVKGFLDSNWTASEAIGERLTFNQFHNEVLETARFFRS